MRRISTRLLNANSGVEGSDPGHIESNDFSRLTDPSVTELSPFLLNLNFTPSRQIMHIQVTLKGYMKLHAIHTEHHFEGTVLCSRSCYFLASPPRLAYK